MTLPIPLRHFPSILLRHPGAVEGIFDSAAARSFFSTRCCYFSFFLFLRRHVLRTQLPSDDHPFGPLGWVFPSRSTRAAFYEASAWFFGEFIFAFGPMLRNTVDGRNPAPPKRPWNDGSAVNTNKQRFPMVSKLCRVSSRCC